jgi:hypothetical protein
MDEFGSANLLYQKFHSYHLILPGFQQEPLERDSPSRSHTHKQKPLPLPQRISFMAP